MRGSRMRVPKPDQGRADQGNGVFLPVWLGGLRG